MSEMKLPWDYATSEHHLYDADGNPVASFDMVMDEDLNRERAEFAKHAVNSHTQLVEALEMAREYVSIIRQNLQSEAGRRAVDPIKPNLDKIDAALAAAKPQGFKP